MDTHNKPYTCTHLKCFRNKHGFSRKDNLNIHLKSHLTRKARNMAENSATTQDAALRRVELTAQKEMIRILVKTANALMSRIESEQEEDLPEVPSSSGGKSDGSEMDCEEEPARDQAPC